MKKRFREIAALAKQVGIKGARVAQKGGKHARLTGVVGGQEISIPVACTPGDNRRGDANWQAELRRKVRAIETQNVA